METHANRIAQTAREHARLSGIHIDLKDRGRTAPFPPKLAEAGRPPVFLAAGIAAETYVVAQKVFEDVSWCMTGALATFGGMIFLWYAVPLLLKARIRRAALPL
jgi:hypothetical protein